MAEQDSAVGTTGHDWDGITELNTPLPRWWLWTFYLTIIWGIGYCIAYPAIPLIDGASRGLLGYSSRGELAETMSDVARSRQNVLDLIAQADVAAIHADETLAAFAVAGGASAFKVHCVQCHGSGAAGSAGYPNLNDDDWIWGGSLDAIYQTISHGVRDEASNETRYSEMPAFGTEGLLDSGDIRDTTAFVLSLGGRAAGFGDRAAGATLFAENCASCHGDTGEGMRELGAPSLTDPIWLYGAEAETIRSQIASPSHGVMPGWRQRLGDSLVKQLTLYVHSLGGGE